MKQDKKTILIVDDSELNRALLADMLADSFDIVEAENGVEAMGILHDRELEISLMLLDIVMPEMDGFEVLAAMNNLGYIKTIPVIIISAEVGGVYIDRAYDLGAIDYISRPFDERTVKHRVTSNFMLTLKHKEMSEMLSSQIYEKEKDNRLMIEILSHIVEFRNGESGLHVLHVHAITEMLLNELMKQTDKYRLSNKDLRLIANASALHDIGKITIPSEILNKPGRFTREEFEVMKTHTTEGAKMLDDIPFRQNELLIKYSYEICRWHHERYDGRGYPDGLKGDAIPISAQVVSMADVYDALTAKRCYKDPFPPEVAVDMKLNGECGEFNPVLLDCLKAIAESLKAELELLSIGNVTDNGIDSTVKEILMSDAPEVTNRSLKLLERERMRYKFLSDISSEITFEYIPVPEMIKLPDWISESLGIPSKILNPSANKEWCAIFKKEDFTQFLDKLKNTTPENPVVVDKYLLTIGGEKKWNKIIAKVMWGESEKPEFEGAIGKIMDINDETVALEDMEEKANKDFKTGLFNLQAAKKIINDRLSEKKGKRYALAVFDLDNFKRANDDYGHLFGDEVINEVANRIKKNIRSNDIGARMGGDEFILFMEYNLGVKRQIERIFNKLTGDYKGFYIGVSMGVACAESDSDYDMLFKKADTAMYAVKRNKKCSYRLYDDSLKSLLNSSDGE